MGCAHPDYTVKVKGDYFTPVLYEASKINKKKQAERVEEKKINAIKEEEERIKNDKELQIAKEEQLKEIEEALNKSGPIGFFDQLIDNEIPEMDFGNQATHQEMQEELGINNNDDDDEEEEEEEEIEERQDNEKDKEKQDNYNNEKKEKEDNKKKDQEKTEGKDEENKNDDEIQEKGDNKEGKDNKEANILIDEKDEKEEDFPNENNLKQNEENNINDKTSNKASIHQIKPTATTTKTVSNPKSQSKRAKLTQIVEEQESELPKDDNKELAIIVIGAQKCGKTSFITKYTRGTFDTIYVKTKEVIVNRSKIVKLEGEEHNIIIKMIDTPPILNKRNDRIVQQEIMKAHIIIYIFDICEEDALFKIKINFFNFHFKEKQLKVIVGNKLDLQTKFTELNKKQVEDYCRERNFLWDFLSCNRFTQELLGKWFEMKIIPEYYDRKNGVVRLITDNNNNNPEDNNEQIKENFPNVSKENESVNITPESKPEESPK